MFFFAYNFMRSKWERLKKKLYDIAGITAAGGTLVGLGGVAVLIGAAGSAALGALAGEIVDHIPYLNYAIPKTLEEIFKTNYFYGNLDKLGATLGFIGGFFKSYIRVEK